MIFYNYPRFAGLASMILISSVGAAQTAERGPLTAPTKVLSASYQSAFSDYISYQEPGVMPWQTANEVVREFGSMAAMNGQHSTHGADEKGGTPEGSQHDMGKMQHQPLPPTERPQPAGSKPSESGHAPEHDMSKMQGTSNANKVTPKPNAQDMKGQKSMDDMKEKPGHDLSNMKEKAAPAPGGKSPTPPGKPAPKTMHDHSGMK